MVALTLVSRKRNFSVMTRRLAVGSEPDLLGEVLDAGVLQGEAAAVDGVAEYGNDPRSTSGAPAAATGAATASAAMTAPAMMVLRMRDLLVGNAHSTPDRR